MRILHLQVWVRGSEHYANLFHKEWTEANAFQGLRQMGKNTWNETISGFQFAVGISGHFCQHMKCIDTAITQWGNVLFSSSSKI
jgi:hypothetical protein